MFVGTRKILGASSVMAMAFAMAPAAHAQQSPAATATSDDAATATPQAETARPQAAPQGDIVVTGTRTGGKVADQPVVAITATASPTRASPRSARR